MQELGENPTAKDVAEHMLDVTGEAYRTGNPEMFSNCFSVPQYIDTFEGRRHLATKSDVTDVFQAMHRYMNSIGVTDLVRHCKSAVYFDQNTVHHTHETRLIKDNILLQDPFTAFSTLKRFPDGWKITFSQYAITDAPAINEVLSGASIENKKSIGENHD